MSDATTHLLLPYILAAQAQKHVTHNEALRILDGLVQLSVLDRDLTAPPGSPADGDRYIVGSGATGNWAGWDLNVALWTDGAWLRLPPRAGWRAAILAKIEKPSAVECFDEILAAADGIMIARGDLGVELPVQAVPPIQKRLIRRARAAAKPVIVATQMLESMITSPIPTRAEVSDVATAIYEGADAVMLSAESAAGSYPVEAVATMNNVAVEVENDPTYRSIIDASRAVPHRSVADGIVAAAREIAETSDIRAICCYTESGHTVRLVARERPAVPIIALTSVRAVARRLCLSWGCHTLVTEGPMTSFTSAVLSAVRAARRDGFAAEADQIVVTAGLPFNVPGSTNILRVAPCDEALILRADPESA